MARNSEHQDPTSGSSHRHQHHPNAESAEERHPRTSNNLRSHRTKSARSMSTASSTEPSSRSLNASRSTLNSSNHVAEEAAEEAERGSRIMQPLSERSESRHSTASSSSRKSRTSRNNHHSSSRSSHHAESNSTARSRSSSSRNSRERRRRRRRSSSSSTSSAGAASGSFHVSRRHGSVNRRSRQHSSLSRGSRSASRESSLPDLATISSTNTVELIVPGAMDNDTVSVLSYNDASTIRSSERSRHLVEATVAQDYEDELARAREEGRREALNGLGGVTPTNRNIAVAVPTGTEDDDDDDGSNEDDLSKDGEDENDNKKRTVLCYVALICCILIAIGLAGTLLLFRNKSGEPPVLMPKEDYESNLKGVIVYNPPTQEECQAIANGTLLEDQQALIQRSFDIRIDITLDKETDFGPLLSDLIRHIQQKLLPIIAGCGAIDFFDATMAIADGIANSNNSTMANGQVSDSRVEECAENPQPNCKSYVLILDLYLEEDRSTAILLEVLGETITSDEITNALGTMYPIQTASVPAIMATNDNDAVTTVPEPTSTPDEEDDASEPTITTTSPPAGPPTLAPTTAAPVTSEPIPLPTFAPVPSPTASSVPVPTNAPIEDATSSPVTSAPLTSAPSPKQTTAPTPNPTNSPTTKPTKSPTLPPSPPPTTTSPTKSPTARPTTKAPTKAPTEPPTEAETTTTFCCSRDFVTCGGVDPICQVNQEACLACNEAVWIEEGSCPSGLGRNDDCSANPTGCCAGQCVAFGNTMQCRLV